jgi:hypothetical protein
VGARVNDQNTTTLGPTDQTVTDGAPPEMIAASGTGTSWQTIETLLLDQARELPPRPLNIDSECVSCPASQHNLLPHAEEVANAHPHAPACRSFGVFREQAKVRRPRSSLAQGIDRWENSGGRKGSTVWPAENPRLRCQYGKVTRDGRGPLKYHEYTFIQPHEPGAPNRHLTPELLQRHLYMVLPAGQASGLQRGGLPRKDRAPVQKRRALQVGETKGPAAPGWVPNHQAPLPNQSQHNPRSEADDDPVPLMDARVLPALQAAELCATDGALTTEAVNALMQEVANNPDSVVGRGRPRLLGEDYSPIAIEIGPSCRRFRRTASVGYRQTGDAAMDTPRMDRWVNAGGKRAVVIA